MFRAQKQNWVQYDESHCTPFSIWNPEGPANRSSEGRLAAALAASATAATAAATTGGLRCSAGTSVVAHALARGRAARARVHGLAARVRLTAVRAADHQAKRCNKSDRQDDVPHNFASSLGDPLPRRALGLESGCHLNWFGAREPNLRGRRSQCSLCRNLQAPMSIAKAQKTGSSGLSGSIPDSHFRTCSGARTVTVLSQTLLGPPAALCGGVSEGG